MPTPKDDKIHKEIRTALVLLSICTVLLGSYQIVQWATFNKNLPKVIQEIQRPMATQTISAAPVKPATTTEAPKPTTTKPTKGEVEQKPVVKYPAPTEDMRGIVALVNEIRKERGLKLLKFDPLLSAAAQAKADDMINKGYFAHVSPNGETVTTFVRKAGYQYSMVLENLGHEFKAQPGTGYTAVNATLNAWYNSPTHFENIVYDGVSDTGIGINGDVIVQLFGEKFTF